MIFYLAWVLIGATIFLSMFYLTIYWGEESEQEEVPELTGYPSLTILMPAYNEEDVVEESVESALDVDYSNLEVFLIDDGSTDSTLEKARKYEDNEKFTIIEHEVNQGKAAALNTGIEKAESEYIVVQDADSRIGTDLVEKSLAKLENKPELGAVIGAIDSFSHETFIQRMQRIQYRLTNFYRSLMARIDTLDVTPGAFSIYRTQDVRDVGGFDLNNPTEDLEMAWKLRENGKSIDMVFSEYSSTHYPETFRDLYNQRVRWKRGSIVNSFKYRHMFFDSSYGWFGRLQLPIHIMTPLLAAASFAMVIAGLVELAYSAAINFSAVGLTMPSFQLSLMRTLLNIQWKIYLPLGVALVISAYVIQQAYEKAGEEVRHPVALTAYYLVYFVIEAVFVMAAILKEMLRTERVWN